MSIKKNFAKTIGLFSVAALALTACGGDDSGNGDTTEAGGDKGQITIGVFNGWEEGIAASELWAYVLEEEGYEVELQYADPAPVFQGVADGDYDFTMDVWEPITHASYLENYGDQLEHLNTWNDEASLHLAVNEDAPIESLDELADHADEFGNRIIGIEPGAGLTGLTEDEVIPTYGLEGMEYATSSTPAMISELSTAVDNGENIVVTTWRPHWVYEAFPLRDLEDPEGTLGEAESMNTYASQDFVEEFPEVTEWLRNFTMDSDLLYSLENEMFNENEDVDDYRPVVEEWAAENQEFIDSLTQ